jgi:hypothetical protein
MRLGYYQGYSNQEEHNIETEMIKPTPRRPVGEVILPD